MNHHFKNKVLKANKKYLVVQESIVKSISQIIKFLKQALINQRNLKKI